MSADEAILTHPMVGLQADDDAPPYYAGEEEQDAKIAHYNATQGRKLQAKRAFNESQRRAKEKKIAKRRRKGRR